MFDDIEGIVYLDRANDLGIARVATLQALHRTQIPANAQVALDRVVYENGVPVIKTTAMFLCPRRFVLWAVKEGYVPDQFRKDALRYVRG